MTIAHGVPGWWLAAAMLATMACTADPPAPGAPTTPQTPPVRVLMLTATAGFRHGSIGTARMVMTDLAARTGAFTVTATETLADVTPDRLATTDVLFFALTSGELAFTDAQKQAIVGFVEGGGGFMGAHSATDTLYDWEDYGRLIGARFDAHPWTQEATVIVESATHPATRALGASFELREEYYTFQENPRERVNVLLALDPSSVGATGDFPLAWSHAVGQGRAFYTALGHFDETWTDPRFEAHLLGAIRWTAGRE